MNVPPTSDQKPFLQATNKTKKWGYGQACKPESEEGRTAGTAHTKERMEKKDPQSITNREACRRGSFAADGCQPSWITVEECRFSLSPKLLGSPLIASGTSGSRLASGRARVARKVCV